MNNLTIKKIAFGILLAGYASSSAFALVANTQSAISGNAPVLYSKSSGAEAHTLTVKFASDDKGQNILGKTDPIKVGQYMVISFDLKDDDGDEDTGQILESLTLHVKVGDAWKDIERKDLEASREKGKIVIKLDGKFAGATKIGFTLQERTEFGLPSNGEWLRVANIWNSANPTPSPEKPTTPPKDGDKPGPSNDPVDLPEPTGPILSDDFRIAIYKVENSVAVKDVDYSTQAVAPQYGETFTAVVLDNAGQDFTSSFSFVWKLKGEYEGVKADVNEVLTKGTTIVLGSSNLGEKSHNSMYNTAYKAGAQGYQLEVSTTTAEPAEPTVG
jgi:hypothetical protein